MISSPANPAIARARRLRKRLWRERQGLILVEGHRVVRAALDGDAGFREVFYTATAERLRGDLLERVRGSGATVKQVTPAVMAALCTARTASDIVGITALPERPARMLRSRPMSGVILDGVRDPRAAGAILATAASLRCSVAVAATGTADLFDPATVRAAGGAHFALAAVRGITPDEAAEAVRAGGSRVVSLADTGPAPWELDLAGPLVLHLPGEAGGALGDPVCLPGSSIAPPLAASAAAVLYEWERQGGAR